MNLVANQIQELIWSLKLSTENFGLFNANFIPNQRQLINLLSIRSFQTASELSTGKILFLVPSISLLGQILYEQATFAENPFNYICVCSDNTISKKTDDEKINFDLIICDEAHRTTGYGEKFTDFTFFGDAVEKNLLSNYKVLILTVNKPLNVGNKKISTDDKEKVAGCINALQKKLTDIDILGDPAPMKTAVAFCSRINDSKNIAEEFKAQGISAVHVDGKMTGDFRSKQLGWLKNTPDNDCRIITNARCLSEGVDVPSLDAILFLSSKPFASRYRSSRRARHAQGSR